MTKVTLISLSTVDFSQAKAFMRSQRDKIEPKIYNRKRRFERPIPIIPDFDRTMMPPPLAPAPRSAALIRRRRFTLPTASLAPNVATIANNSSENSASISDVIVSTPSFQQTQNNQNRCVSAESMQTDSIRSLTGASENSILQPTERDSSSLAQKFGKQVQDQNLNESMDLDSDLNDLAADVSENISSEHDYDPSFDQYADRSFDDAQSNIQQIQSTPCLAVVPFGSISTKINVTVQSNIGQPASTVTSPVLKVKREPLPLLEMNHENAEEVSDLFEDDVEEEFYGDVIMTYKRFPMPFRGATDDELIKQENDVVSGNLPFSLRVIFPIQT